MITAVSVLSYLISRLLFLSVKVLKNKLYFIIFLIFSMVLADLFLSVLEYNLKEIAYAADVAQLGYVLIF